MTCSMVYVVHVKQKYKVAKKFYFPIFPAFTLHSQWLTVGSSCIHLLYPLRIVCAHHSESAHLALTVCSAFTYHSVPLQFIFNSKVKGSVFASLNKMSKEHVHDGSMQSISSLWRKFRSSYFKQRLVMT